MLNHKKTAPIIQLQSVTKAFPHFARVALRDVSARIHPDIVVGVVGPDGAGKTTLLRLLAGLMTPTTGTIRIFDTDPADPLIRQSGWIAYLPQHFALYEELTVVENLRLYADLRGIPGKVREPEFARLLRWTGLERFQHRLARNLSGGMKQKLGLACVLLSRPRILLLDEPTVGVDPLSRRELWSMVQTLRQETGVTVLWSTPYLDEAERCDDILLLSEGQLLFQGHPQRLAQRVQGKVFQIKVPETQKRKFVFQTIENPQVIDSTVAGSFIRLVLRDLASVQQWQRQGMPIIPGNPRLEDGVLALLYERNEQRQQIAVRPLEPARQSQHRHAEEVVVSVRDITKRFGTFTAVDHIEFEVRRGEIFGILGPNGAGKTTTFKMLCGLLKPTSGVATVAGVDLLKAPAAARARIGYMAQKFSLYGDLTIEQNLEFFGGIYGLPRQKLRTKVEAALREYQLQPYAHTLASMVPRGYQQRLAMACAVLHDPSIVFLDEPTSGVDPVMRREFWLRIFQMVESGVSVVVTTHYMDEAEYCDRIALMYGGKIIALGSPEQIKDAVRSDQLPDPTLEDAFIALVQQHFAAMQAER